MKIRFLFNIIIALVLIVATAEYDGERAGIIETLEKQNYDWRLSRNEVRKNKDIVIVDIDRESLRAYGNWPWSRNHFANLNNQLFEKYKVRLLAYALPFAERDDAAIRLLDDIKEKLDTGAAGRSYLARIDELRNDLDYDKRFADSLRKREVVLGYLFTESGRIQAKLPSQIEFNDNNVADKTIKVPYPLLGATSKNWRLMRGYSGNLPLLVRSLNGVAGHLNVNIDDDGVVRSAPAFVKHGGSYYESAVIAVALRLQGLYDGRLVGAELNSDWSLFGSDYTMEKVFAGRYSAPLSPSGSFGINFLGSGGRSARYESTSEAVFRYIPFIDVVKGDANPEHLENKIVLVGSSSPQLRDMYPTPVNPVMPGVELAATQLANFLEGDTLWRLGDTVFHETLILLLVALVLSVLFVYLGPLLSFPVLLVVAGTHIFYVLYQWEENNLIWSMTPLLLVISGIFIFNAIAGFVFEWRSSRRLQSTFGQYVPPEFARRIGKSGSEINLEGEERELSVLFSDVRNFTAVSEKLSPRDLTLLMNRMLTRLSEAVHQNDGTVDKYIGDAVMAFWNAPLHDKEHAKKSVLAAMAMQKAMKEVSDGLVADGFQEMRLGVGICTGNANVGNMGSTLRMTYTAIGDTVNLASRTEGLTKYYGIPILVTETTRSQCDSDIVFRTVDMVRVKGRNQPVLLYEPYGLAKLVPLDMIDHLKVFEQAVQKYFAGDFGEAAELLRQYQTVVADDALATVYHKRLQQLLKDSPAEWDGVISYDVK